MGVTFQPQQLLRNRIFSTKMANVYVSGAIATETGVLSNRRMQAENFNQIQ